MPKIFDSWEEAAKASVWNKAISSPRTIKTSRGKYVVDIVKGPTTFEHYVYDGAQGLTVHDAKPSSSEIDSEKRWRPY